MIYALLKTLHILSATLFLGAGLASVFYKLRADREGDLKAIVFAHRNVVLADWIFTIPSGVLLPVSGIGMAHMAGYPLFEGWIGWGFTLYVIAGVCWLPAFFLQFKMRDAAEAALRDNTPLPPEFYRWTRIWAGLGVPAFFAAVGAILMMTAKGAVL